MSVIAFATQFPRAARRLISISGSPAASPFAIALRSVQREAILRDPDWQGGQYAPDHPPRNGMRVARKLGTITYRSAAEWRQRFGREPLAGNAAAASSPFAPRFAVEGYLEAQAERFTRIFDANCYLYLSSAMDRFDLAEHGGSYRRGAARGARRARAGHRRRERHAVPDRRAGRDRRGLRAQRHRRRASRACPRSRVTTPSWSTSRASTPRSAPFSPEPYPPSDRAYGLDPTWPPEATDARLMSSSAGQASRPWHNRRAVSVRMSLTDGTRS